jgi:MYXO-CTERM domain-containing protein
VECVTDTNCAPFGVACTSGRCGFCGDGTCSPREGIDLFEQYFQDPSMSGGRENCSDDCAGLCPTVDLGGALGDALGTVQAAAQQNLFSTYCSATGGFGPDASFLWTAPHTGTFVFESTSSTQPGTLVGLFSGGCGGYEMTCGTEVAMDLAEGDAVLIVLDTDEAPTGSYVLGIHEDTSSGPVAPDGGVIDNAVVALCLDNAAARGETLCDEGTRCACEHCPRDYDDCAVIPGCQEVRACMVEHACVGADCYNSGACRGVIDSYQGISGPAFRASAALESCALTFDCQLPCDPSDSGSAPSPSSDAGQLCSPGREVACACGDGGHGTQRCSDSGAAFSPCECGGVPEAGSAPATPKNDDEGGCGCRVNGAPEDPTSTLLAAGALAAAVLARRRAGERRVS